MRLREWVFVERVLDRRSAVFLTRRGAGVDHPSAAANIAALIEVVAQRPGRRILNSADPDAPSGLEIARTIGRQLDHAWDDVLLDDDADETLGRHPWDTHPIVFDMNAATDLGYVPVGDYATTVAEEIERLVAAAGGVDGAEKLPPPDDPYLAPPLDQAAEDRYLSAATANPGAGPCFDNDPGPPLRRTSRRATSSPFISAPTAARRSSTPARMRQMWLPFLSAPSPTHPSRRRPFRSSSHAGIRG